MIVKGVIRDDLEATLPIVVLGPSGRQASTSVVVDTGFNGYLTLPAQTIADLDLSFHSLATAELGDGRIAVLRKFEGRVLWNEVPRDVTILETDSAALLGMAFLLGHRLTADVAPGQEVSISAIPRR